MRFNGSAAILATLFLPFSLVASAPFVLPSASNQLEARGTDLGVHHLHARMFFKDVNPEDIPKANRLNRDGTEKGPKKIAIENAFKKNLFYANYAFKGATNKLSELGGWLRTKVTGRPAAAPASGERSEPTRQRADASTQHPSPGPYTRAEPGAESFDPSGAHVPY